MGGTYLSVNLKLDTSREIVAHIMRVYKKSTSTYIASESLK